MKATFILEMVDKREKDIQNHSGKGKKKLGRKRLRGRKRKAHAKFR